MLVGYVRVSTLDQNPQLQQDALQEAQCDRIFTDTISGAKTERPGLDEALRFLRTGDTLVV
jgi:DNA invertase Pin-like site-specific DNA recombinase